MAHAETEIPKNILPITNPGVNPIDARFSARISRYQWFFYVIVFLAKIIGIWHILNLMILNPPITYQCDNKTDACPCSNPDWDRSVFTETVQTKFGLICDTKYKIHLSETLTYFGMLVGAMFFGVMSDRFGRLVMFCVSYVVIGVAGTLVSVSPNIATFCVFRLFEGMGAGGTIVTSFVLLIEYSGSKHREIATALYHLPINIGHMAISGVSYMLRSSFNFQLAISIPAFIFAFTWLVLSESPVWLLDRNREKAIKTMEKIAKFNKIPDPTIRTEIEQFSNSSTSHPQYKIYHIFKYRTLTKNLACMSYLYFICGMGYYGVSQYISKMSGNFHFNIVLSALLVMPGTIASVFLLTRIGRKPFLATTCFVSGVFMIITVLIPKSCPHWVKVLFASISNCFFFMAFIVVFLFGVELFPTQIRNSALGFLSLLSRAGMMAAPPINSLSQIISGFVFGVMAIVGGLLTMCLPETKNRELPNTLEEANLQK